MRCRACSAVYIIFALLRKADISFVMSARPSVCLSIYLSAWNDSTATGRAKTHPHIHTEICKTY